MDIDTTTTDAVINDDALDTDASETPFGKEIAKTLVISTATSAGSLAGMIAIAYAYGKVADLRAKRAAKKAAPAEVIETPTTVTPTKDK